MNKEFRTQGGQGLGSIFSYPNDFSVTKFEFQILTIIMTRPSPPCIYIPSLVCAPIVVFAISCPRPGWRYADFRYMRIDIRSRAWLEADQLRYSHLRKKKKSNSCR